MKAKAILVTMAIVTALSAGCAKQPAPATTPAPTPAPAPAPTTAPAPAAVTSASIVDNEAAFEKAISKDGTWIIAPLKDLTYDKEIVLDGEFKNGKKDAAGNDVIQRKIALYTQDDKRNITGTFTLTAPKLTINSPNAGLWYGTFKGDIYVSAPNFTLFGATVDGNIYFTNADAQKTFKLDESKQPVKITGKQELVK